MKHGYIILNKNNNFFFKINIYQVHFSNIFDAFILYFIFINDNWQKKILQIININNIICILMNNYNKNKIRSKQLIL